MIFFQVVDGFGRKTILVFCQALAGATCIIAAFIPKDFQNVIVTLTLAGTNHIYFKILIRIFKEFFLIPTTYLKENLVQVLHLPLSIYIQLNYILQL